jgi:hypothetical protein
MLKSVADDLKALAEFRQWETLFADFVESEISNAVERSFDFGNVTRGKFLLPIVLVEKLCPLPRGGMIKRRGGERHRKAEVMRILSSVLTL